MFKVIQLFIRSVSRSIDLYFFLRKKLELDIIKLGVLRGGGKIITMLVMFLPLKVLLLVSGSSQVDFISQIEVSIGRDSYIVLILLLTTLLYIINIVLQVYYNRLYNEQCILIKNNKTFIYKHDSYTREYINRAYKHNIALSGDMFIIVLTLLISLLLSFEYFIGFIFSLIIYSLLVQYFVYTDNKFKFLQNFKINDHQVLNVFNSAFYLFLFFLLFYLFLNGKIEIYSSIFILLLSRVCSHSVKGALLSIGRTSMNEREYCR